jgi:type II secretory pathway component PulJ
MRRHHRGIRGQSAGFTLLELLIAVGLTSVLMIALFSAMSIYFNLQLDSHEEIARQQIARAVLRQMTRDIQSVVFVKQEVVEEETEEETVAPADLDGNSYGESVIDPETVSSTYTNGIVGTATDLQLFVSRPDRNLAYVSSQELTSADQRTGDLLLVRYLMASRSGGGLGSKIAEREAPGETDGPVGMVRMEGDLYGLSTAFETDEEFPQLAAAKLQAREVSSLAFRYFDGAGWIEEWDSTARNELPRAIEIVLTIRDTEGAGMAFSDDEPDAYALPETTHRMVVPLPLAEPFTVEAVL